MTKVAVFGGSGFAGKHIVEAASVRGLDVTSVTRGEVAEQFAGVTYLRGSLTDAETRARVLSDADVVIVAVSPRGDMAGNTRAAVAAIAAEAATAGVRLGVIGGAGSLLVSEGGPRLVDTDAFAPEYKPEALEMADVLDDLRTSGEGLDWFLLSPAGTFGAFAPGTYRGEYRVGGDVLLTDEHGESAVSGADFGVAVVDEIEDPKHHRARFTVAY